MTWDHRLVDDPEERAAIMEYDGGLERIIAEWLAGAYHKEPATK